MIKLIKELHEEGAISDSEAIRMIRDALPKLNHHDVQPMVSACHMKKLFAESPISIQSL